MSGWKTTALFLGAVCAWQQWRACTRRAPVACTQVECEAITRETSRTTANRMRDDAPARDEDSSSSSPLPVQSEGFSAYGFKVPGWVRSFAPQPGEDLRAYRDRMIPFAQMAVAPHRARVARSSTDFATVANLDPHQRAELDAAATETATAIQDRLFNAVLSGEVSPSTFKPMAGVAVARDVLDLVDRANKRFVGSLREDQRLKLSEHPFDFADYLVFSTKWEDAISGL